MHSSDEKLSRVIVALDDMDKDGIHHFLSNHHSKLARVKIGMEIFYRYGRPFLEEVHQKYNLSIFLDLKVHDIPNTVAKALGALAGLPVEFLTIHLSGGRSMLNAAAAEVKKSLPGTKLLGVTYLTSLGAGDFEELWKFRKEDMREHFNRLVDLAVTTGMDGLILSPLELDLVKDVPLLKICPGIRFAEEGPGGSADQKRVATPEDALRNGADFLVIGRSLTKASPNLLSARLKQLSDFPA